MVIRAALNQPRRGGLVDQNEASKITLTKCHPNKRVCFSMDQIKRLLSVANEDRRTPHFFTGLLLTLMITDLNAARTVISGCMRGDMTGRLSIWNIALTLTLN